MTRVHTRRPRRLHRTPRETLPFIIGGSLLRRPSPRRSVPATLCIRGEPLYTFDGVMSYGFIDSGSSTAVPYGV